MIPGIPGIPDFAVGICHRLARRFADCDDARQDLLLQAWLHRDLSGPVLTTCLQRRAIDRRRRIGGEWRRGAGRPRQLTGMPFREPTCRAEEATEYVGPESDIARLIADGWSFKEIAELRGVHPSNITRRVDRIRDHLASDFTLTLE